MDKVPFTKIFLSEEKECEIDFGNLVNSNLRTRIQPHSFTTPSSCSVYDETRSHPSLKKEGSFKNLKNKIREQK